MPRKKTKKPYEMGEVERLLHDIEQQKKTAESVAAKALKPAASKALAKPLEPFYTQQAKHKYGTCWKCGHSRLNAGGTPGGYETYYCHVCQQYLTIRHVRSDTPRLNIHYKK